MAILWLMNIKMEYYAEVLKVIELHDKKGNAKFFKRVLAQDEEREHVYYFCETPVSVVCIKTCKTYNSGFVLLLSLEVQSSIEGFSQARSGDQFLLSVIFLNHLELFFENFLKLI